MKIVNLQKVAIVPKMVVGVLAVVACLSVAPSSRADLLIDFDPPTYTTGNIFGQNGWGYGLHYGSTVVGSVVATPQAISGPNVLQMTADYNFDGSAAALYNTNNGGLLSNTSGLITFYYQQVVAPSMFAQSIEFSADNGTNPGIIQLGMGTPQSSGNKSALVYNDGNNTMITATNMFVTGDWYKFTIAYTPTTYSLRLENYTTSALLLNVSGLGYTNNAVIDNDLSAVQVMAFDGTSYYDNISVTAVPEPSTWMAALLGLSLLAVLRGRAREGKVSVE